MRAIVLGLLLVTPLAAQAQAPAAGTGGGGPVGPSVSTPNTPPGTAPPGTPSGTTTGDQALRNAASKDVIGKTETPATAVPGNTTAPDAGVRK